MTEVYPAKSKFNEPIMGPTYDAFEEFVKNERDITDKEDLNMIKKNAQEIIKRCLFLEKDNKHKSQRTVLHIGEVQSGKTLTMCSVIALAYDNDFFISTILTGTKNILKAQNQDRIKEVLNAIDPGNKKFSYYSFDPNSSEPKDDEQLKDQIKSLVERKKFIKKNKMIVLCMLKHEKYINDISDLFSSKELNVCNFPIQSLILDDEADQASPNTQARKNNNKRSSTNKSIVNLKQNHTKFCTYIQVTATAQALLLTDKNDPLSPDYVWVSSSSKKYIGIKNYFITESLREKFIFDIDSDDIPDPSEADAEMPKTLQQSIHYFIVSCAIAESIKLEKPLKPPFTMLCHPHWGKEEHKRYSTWIRNYINTMKSNLLDSDFEDEVFEDLKLSFNNAIKNFKNTNLKFEDVKNSIGEIIEGGISQSIINDSNPIQGNLKDFWNRSNYHIIIGGNCIDRGFTVEGILVTYLSRKPGKNSDTIQQRARFCGYKKRDHFNLSRLFIDSENKDFFHKYIVLEEVTRNGLKKNISEFKPQDKAGFVLLLPKPFQPTRKNIHTELNIGSADEWFKPKFCQFLNKRKQDSNYELFEELFEEFLPSFKRSKIETWRCFESDQLNISNLVKIMTRFQAYGRDELIKNIYKGIVDAFPDDYPSKKNILTCLMVDAETLEYPSLESFIIAKQNNFKKLFMDRGFSFPKYNQKIMPETNLQRGISSSKKPAKWSADIDVCSKDKITLQISLVNFRINNKSQFNESIEIHREINSLFNNGPTLAISMRFPNVGRWRTFSK